MDRKNELNRLIENIVEKHFSLHPFVATMAGYHKYDREVPDFSKEALAGQLRTVKGFMEDIKRLDREGLDGNGQIDLTLLNIVLREMARSMETLKTYEKTPGYVANSIMTTAYIMATREYKPLPYRMKDLMKRLKKVPHLLEQQRDLIDSPPRVFTEIAIQQTRGGIQFFEGMKAIITEKVRFLAPLITGPLHTTIEAFQEHLKWLEHVLPLSQGDFAVGEDIFTEMLQNDHCLDYTAPSLLAKGWELFQATKEQIKEISGAIDPNKTPEELLAQLQNQHPQAEELLPFYARELKRSKQFVRDQGVVDIPEGEELIIEETPVFQRTIIPYPTYIPPAPFESKQEGRFWVTPVDPNSSPEEQAERLQGHSIYKIPVITVHEAYPGHHLQLVWSNTNPSLIRKLAQRILFLEGWAFYCEELMEQLGFFADQRITLARLKDQLWLAARIILDVSLHTGQMTIAEAIAFLTEQVGLEKSDATAEVYQYTTSPTQPMSYLIGKLEILALADEYKRHKGNAYHAKEFHNQLLSLGAIPPALARKVLW